MTSHANHRFLLALAGLLVSALLAGCYGDIREFCEGWSDCYGGNDEDEKACVEYHKGERKAAAKYDCKDEFDKYFECAASKYKCDDDYWTDEGKCNKQAINYYECIDKASGIDW